MSRNAEGWTLILTAAGLTGSFWLGTLIGKTEAKRETVVRIGSPYHAYRVNTHSSKNLLDVDGRNAG